MRRLLPFLAACAAWGAAEPSLRLEITLDPPVDEAPVSLTGVDDPYRDQTRSHKGRAHFSKLKPGAYTVAIYHPRWGETRRTYSVSPGLANEKGRVSIEIRLRESELERSRALQDAATVDVRELEISDAARQAHRRASRALERRDADEAIRLLEKAVSLSPQFAEAWNDLGTIANHREEFVEAEEYFERALEADPSAFAPNVNLGGVLLAQGRFEEAVLVNQYAVRQRPSDALANAQLGICYFYLKQTGLALKYLLAARQIDPGHFTHPQLFLAEIHAGQGRLDVAARELREMIRLHPDSYAAEKARQALASLEDGAP